MEASRLTSRELATIDQYDLPVKTIILNNQYLGMVRQWQEFFFERRYSESYYTRNPDFAEGGRGVRNPRYAHQGSGPGPPRSGRSSLS